ncbi:MAG: phenylalanine--tRNA ligase subunit beta [Deltaproteobacteria bacterium]|nr:phenylalanine--tRNA ligase subunit beta [Deltaproteobacteria bacterium]
MASTEASHRFERGTDPIGLSTALDRLCHWVRQLAGGVVARGAIDVVARPYVARRISFRPDRARSLLGVELADSACVAALRSIGIESMEVGTPSVEATVPSWRPDLEREVDLIEEIARIVGYDQIPASTTTIGGGNAIGSPCDPVERRLERARDVLADHGYREVIRLAFTSPDVVRRFGYPDGRAEAVRIANPLGEDGSVLPTSLLPGLVESARLHLNHGATSVRLFQAARVHRRAGGRWPYREIDCVAAVAAGPRGLGPFPESAAKLDFYDLKGTLEILAERLGMKGVAFRPAAGLQYAEVGHCGEVWCNDRKVGELLMFSTELLATFGVDIRLFGFELELTDLEPYAEPRYASFSRLPTALRDVAIEVPDAAPAGEIATFIARARWVIGVDLFDVYRGAGLPDGRKSLGFHLRLQHPERSLTEAEIGGVLEGIVRDLEAAFGAKRR